MRDTRLHWHSLSEQSDNKLRKMKKKKREEEKITILLAYRFNLSRSGNQYFLIFTTTRPNVRLLQQTGSYVTWFKIKTEVLIDVTMLGGRKSGKCKKNIECESLLPHSHFILFLFLWFRSPLILPWLNPRSACKWRITVKRVEGKGKNKSETITEVQKISFGAT